MLYELKTSREQCIRTSVTRMERVQMSYDTEKLVAQVFEGEATSHRAPIDVVTDKYGIEVKAFHKESKTHKCRMTKEAIQRKKEFCKKKKLKPKTILAVVNDKIELYEKAGFGNFRKENMKKIGDFPRGR